MKDTKVLSAAKMAVKQSGSVMRIEGGHAFIRRLEALGIRPGKKIRKVSSAFMQGPSVMEVDGSEIAIGYGMASRIFVKAD